MCRTVFRWGVCATLVMGALISLAQNPKAQSLPEVYLVGITKLKESGATAATEYFLECRDDSEWCRYGLGISYRFLGRHVESFTEFASIETTDVQLLGLAEYGKALAQMELQEYAKALVHIGKTLEIASPGNNSKLLVDAYLLQTQIYFSTGEYTEAERSLNLVSFHSTQSGNSCNPYEHYYRSHVYLTKRNWLPALLSVRDSYQCFTPTGMIYYQSLCSTTESFILLHLERKEEAKEALGKAKYELQLSKIHQPFLDYFHRYLQTAYFGVSDPDNLSASQIWEKLKKYLSEYPDPHFQKILELDEGDN